MQESHGEGIAIHADPESCGAAREGGVEALTGARAGWAIELRKINNCRGQPRQSLRDADAVRKSGRHYLARRYRETLQSPAQSKTPSMYGNTSHENREIPCLPAALVAVGRVGKSKDVSRR